MEIFEYLEGEKLVNAFTDLNTRFESLLDVSNLRMKTCLFPNQFEPPLDFFDKIIALNNGHRILALELFFPSTDDFFHLVPFIDASFIRLESLRLHEIKLVDLIPLLISLADVPRLTSLYIHLNDSVDDASTMYQLIVALPSIRDLQVATDSFLDVITASMPIAKLSTTPIESLTLAHECNVNDLLALLSYTPRLRRLTCKLIAEVEVPLPLEKVNAIPTLTSISINRSNADFDRLESVLTIVAPELQCLTIKCYDNVEFLSAERWERVITQHFPRLATFNFTYVETIDEDFVATRHHEHMHRFTSPFWIKKHWWFNVQIDNDSWYENTVSCVVSTDK